jgi:hypothetical protein
VKYRVRGAPAGAGALVRTLDARWLSDTRVAALVCERLLRQWGRAQWEITASGLSGDIRVGQAVELAHPLVPVVGSHLVLAREFEDSDGRERTRIVVRAAVGSPPEIEFGGNANQSDPIAPVVVTTSTSGNDVEVQVLDVDQQPMSGAECVLDGQVTRFADSAGVVRYPRYLLPPGMHTIVASAPSKTAVTLQFQVP